LTELIKVDAIKPERSLMKKAACVILQGGTVAFPTETVYGLGANAFDHNAARKIFEAKNRPADNPLIVHVSSFDMLSDVCEFVPESVERALKKFWPGPLTVLLQKSEKIPEIVTARLPTVAVRMPAHPVALALIEESGVPIAAPSANLSTRPSPTKAEHVIQDLWGRVDVIIDGGETFFGVESTIIQVEDGKATILRPGPYTREELLQVFEEVEVSAFAKGAKAERAMAPGMKYKHYSPSKPLYLVCDKQKFVEISLELSRKGVQHTAIGTLDVLQNLKSKKIALGRGDNLYEVAKNLFDALRKFDSDSSAFALIHGFPEQGIGLAIMNRLRKACGGVCISSCEEIFNSLGSLNNLKEKSVYGF
jgi:L-threonylcarbamoyladenylate synthase